MKNNIIIELNKMFLRLFSILFFNIKTILLIEYITKKINKGVNINKLLKLKKNLYQSLSKI